MTTQEIDFGRDRVATLFTKMFVPTLMGMLAVASMITIDGVFVGQAVGARGIAAINICVPLAMLFTGFGLMMGVGCSVVASVQLSAGDERRARINITRALLFATIVTIAVSVPVLAAPGWFADRLGASPTLREWVIDYLYGWIPGCAPQIFGMIGLFVIRLDGSPRLAMWCNVIGSIANILLDWVFLYPLGMGVLGAAIASSISVSIGGVIALIYISGYATRLRFVSARCMMRGQRLGANILRQCKIGSSALLGEFTMAVLMFTGNIVFMQWLGDDGVGAFGIACYYLPFVFMVGGAIAQSAQPIISYNMSASPTRSISAQRIALATATAFGAVVTAAFVIGHDALVSLFLNTDTPAARIAIDGLPLFAIGYTFFMLNLTIIGYYQSVERIAAATTFALLRGVILLIPSFLLLPPLWGTPGIWLAMPATEIMTFVIVIIHYTATRHRGLVARAATRS